MQLSLHFVVSATSIRGMHSSQFGFNLGLISRSNFFDKACPNLYSWFCAKSKLAWAFLSSNWLIHVGVSNCTVPPESSEALTGALPTCSRTFIMAGYKLSQPPSPSTLLKAQIIITKAAQEEVTTKAKKAWAAVVVSSRRRTRRRMGRGLGSPGPVEGKVKARFHTKWFCLLCSGASESFTSSFSCFTQFYSWAKPENHHITSLSAPLQPLKKTTPGSLRSARDNSARNMVQFQPKLATVHSPVIW